MYEANQTKREMNAVGEEHGVEAELESSGRKSGSAFVASTRRARELVSERPYFALGVLAGIGVAIAGTVVLLSHRRRTLFERILDSAMLAHVFGR